MTLIIVSVDFEDYELVVGVADSYVQALRLAAQYRQQSRSGGWSYSKVGEVGTLALWTR